MYAIHYPDNNGTIDKGENSEEAKSTMITP